MTKKFLFILAAAAGFAACTKSNVVYENTDEIGIFPVNYTATKAHMGPVDGTDYPAAENFGVFAQFTESDAGTEFASDNGVQSTYLTGVEFTKKADEAVWKGVTPYYWPKTGSLYFAGYSPFSATKTGVSYSFTKGSPSMTVSGFTQGAYVYTDGTSVPDGYSMVDLMWFDVTSTSYDKTSNAPAVTFMHALSYLTLKIKSSAAQSALFKITDIKLNGVKVKGDFVSNGSKAAAAWTPADEPASDLVLYPDATDTEQVLTGTVFTVEDVLVIPQETATLEIVYEQKAADGQPFVKQLPYTVKLTGGDGADTNNNMWLLGKHYTYNLTFTADEILLTPSVEGWENVDKPEVEI